MKGITDFTIDIETIPPEDGRIIERITKDVSHPGNITKPESIEKWYAEKGPGAKDEAVHKAALSGTFGRIFCIAFAVDDGPVMSVSMIGQTESEMLTEFFGMALDATKDSGNRLRWVGHYITGFDLRFLWQRCVVNQIKPGLTIPYDAKPWDEAVFDTCIEWSGLRSSGFGSLDDVTLALNGRVKGELDGSKVLEYVQDGRGEEVVAYCEEDVIRARHAHNMMRFGGAA